MKRKMAQGGLIGVTAILLLTMGIGFQMEAKEIHLTDAEKIYGLSTVWKAAADVYAYWELIPDLDWDQLYLEYIPQVLDTQNTAEYYDKLSELIAYLEDGHTGAIPPLNMQSYYLPIALRYVEGRYIIYARDKKQAAGLPLGSELVKIDGLDAGEYLEQTVGPRTGLHTPNARQGTLARLIYSASSPRTLTVQAITPDGQTVTGTLKYGDKMLVDSWDCEGIKLQIPLDESAPDYKNIEDLQNTAQNKKKFVYDSFRAYALPGGIYQVVLPDFQNTSIDKEFGEFIDLVKQEAKGFILDVRDNNGGSSLNGVAVLSRFLSPDHLRNFSNDYYQVKDASVMVKALWNAPMDQWLKVEIKELLSGQPAQGTEAAVAMYFNRYYTDAPMDAGTDYYAPYRREEYLSQPVVILSDWFTASAGDTFVYQAKGIGRFTVMGTNTKGTDGSVMVYDLPGGGIFMITAIRAIMADGQDIVNHGVQPDIWVEQTVEDLRNGKDTALEAALDYLQRTE